MNELIKEVREDRKKDDNTFDTNFQKTMEEERWGVKVPRSDVAILKTEIVEMDGWSD